MSTDIGNLQTDCEQKVKQIYSHIKLPKLILKNFEDENHTIHCLDAVSKSYRMKRAATINTELGYYSNQMEDFLNKDLERPLSCLVDKIKKATTLEGLRLDGFEYTARDYLKSMYTRDGEVINETIKNSHIIKQLDEQIQHDYVAYSYKWNTNLDLALGWQNKRTAMLLNRSSIPFILPISGIYGVVHDEFGRILIAPITTKHAIVLVDSDTLTEHDIKNVVVLANDNDGMFEKLNKLAFEAQEKRGNGFVMSNRKEVLEKII